MEEKTESVVLDDSKRRNERRRRQRRLKAPLEQQEQPKNFQGVREREEEG